MEAKTKTCVFDGGPLDGQVMELPVTFNIYAITMATSTLKEMSEGKNFGTLEHYYKEDENVPGHFLYKGQFI